MLTMIRFSFLAIALAFAAPAKANEINFTAMTSECAVQQNPVDCINHLTEALTRIYYHGALTQAAQVAQQRGNQSNARVLQASALMARSVADDVLRQIQTKYPRVYAKMHATR